MSFLQSPTTLTPQQILVNNILNGANSLFHIMVQEPTQWFNQIWHNPNPNLTPDVTWAALGTNAVSIRSAFAALGAFLNSLAPGSFTLVEPTTYTLTQNSDGSISAVLNPPSGS
jgi:hypothetical protein